MEPEESPFWDFYRKVKDRNLAQFTQLLTDREHRAKVADELSLDRRYDYGSWAALALTKLHQDALSNVHSDIRHLDKRPEAREAYERLKAYALNRGADPTTRNHLIAFIRNVQPREAAELFVRILENRREQSNVRRATMSQVAALEKLPEDLRERAVRAIRPWAGEGWSLRARWVNFRADFTSSGPHREARNEARRALKRLERLQR